MRKIRIIFETTSFKRSKEYEAIMKTNKIAFHKRILKRPGKSPLINYRIDRWTTDNWTTIMNMVDTRDLEEIKW